MKLPDTSRLVFDDKKHAYKLDGKLLSGVTTIISETSSKGALVQWAANMACEYIESERKDWLSEYSKGKNRLTMEEWATDLLPARIQEARTAHARKRDKSATKGTDTHALVEQYINFCLKHGGRTSPVDNLFAENGPMQTIATFIHWAQENVDQFIAAEQRLYSETHGYAGTCDFIAIMDGKLTIGDLKTFPKMWSADAFIQMGAYSLAYKEMTGEQAEQSIVVKMCDPEDERLKKYGGKSFATYPRYVLGEDEDMFLTRLKMYRYNENFVSPKE